MGGAVEGMSRVKPFVRCQGCDVQTMMIGGEVVPWKYAGQYDAYTGPVAGLKNEWIEKNICPLLKPSSCKGEKIRADSEMGDCDSEGVTHSGNKNENGAGGALLSLVAAA